MSVGLGVPRGVQEFYVVISGAQVVLENGSIDLTSLAVLAGCRVSIRKTFAQFLRNETQNVSFCAHQFCAKKQQFAQSFAKVISRINCPIPLLRNSSFAQFRNFVPKSETDCPVKVSTILVLDMHIS